MTEMEKADHIVRLKNCSNYRCQPNGKPDGVGPPNDFRTLCPFTQDDCMRLQMACESIGEALIELGFEYRRRYAKIQAWKNL